MDNKEIIAKLRQWIIENTEQMSYCDDDFAIDVVQNRELETFLEELEEKIK